MEAKKTCFKCNVEKPISEFYVHKMMGDGHLGKCKECAKNDVRLKYIDDIQSESYLEKERARGREKYKRLNYKERTQYTKPYSNGITKGSAQHFKKLGFELTGKEIHHWNYTLKHCVFIISRRAHKLIHKNIEYNTDRNCFVTSDGIFLDTKEKHYKYIKSTFEENNVLYEIDAYPEPF